MKHLHHYRTYIFINRERGTSICYTFFIRLKMKSNKNDFLLIFLLPHFFLCFTRWYSSFSSSTPHFLNNQNIPIQLKNPELTWRSEGRQTAVLFNLFVDLQLQFLQHLKHWRLPLQTSHRVRLEGLRTNTFFLRTPSLRQASLGPVQDLKLQ